MGGIKYFERQSPAFMVRALIMIVLGVWALVSPQQILNIIVVVIALGLCIFGIIELVRVLHSRRVKKEWGLNLALAICELALGLFLLIFQGAGEWFIAIALGGMLIVRGVLDLFSGIAALKTFGLRILFIVSGLAGVVLGLCVLAYPKLVSTTLIWIVGLYAILVGVANFVIALTVSRKKVKSTSGTKKVAAKKTTAAKATKKK